MDSQYRINQAFIKDSNLNSLNNIMDIGKSICKIIVSNILGTGFFIKLNKINKPLYCLMTNEHVINQDMVTNKKRIKICYDNQHKNLEIILDKNERYIQDFLYIGIDAIIVEILPKDKISNDLFLLPNLEYLNGYEQFKNKKIYIFQFPEGGNLCYSIGLIKNVNSYKNEMSHLASTLKGSSGSPIIIFGSIFVLGIHKQANSKLEENYGNFIGPIIQELEKNNKIEKLFFEGNIYEGELIKDNIKEGKGKLTFRNGEIYIGEFKNDKFNGKGVL